MINFFLFSIVNIKKNPKLRAIMEKITTKDDSITFVSEDFDETYHSTTGAREEAFKKFVEPCKDVIEKNDTIKVLDICFGMGYNSAALLDYTSKYPGKKIFITGLENDEAIINKATYNDKSGFDNYSIIQELVQSQKKNRFKLDKGIIKIKLIVNNARESIKKINNKFHIVFLDPFSPKNCPELWEEEFFKDIYDRMEKGGILTTYSCARLVRDNLKAVGFKVEDGPKVQRRGPSTIATKE